MVQRFRTSVSNSPANSRVEQLDDARPARAGGHDVRHLLDGRQRIVHGNGQPAHPQERLDRSPRRRRRPSVPRRRPGPPSAGTSPVAFVTSEGRAITDPLLKMTCHSEPEVADRREDVMLVRLHRRNDRVPDRERNRLPLAALRRAPAAVAVRLPSTALRRRVVEHRTVLGDDAIEQIECAKMLKRSVQLAAGHHHEAQAAGSARRSSAVDGRRRRRRRRGRSSRRSRWPAPKFASALICTARPATPPTAAVVRFDDFFPQAEAAR